MDTKNDSLTKECSIMREADKSTHYVNYSEWKRWNMTAFGEYSKKENYYYRRLFQKYLRKRDVRILEIGYGNGGLAGWLAKNYPRTKWSGVEIQPHLVKKASDAGFNAYSDLNQITNTYHIVIMLDVLEHLTDYEIKALFTKLENIIEPNGKVIARTPNGAGPMGLPNQTGDPTHITSVNINRLSFYLDRWEITEKGDLDPLWEGRVIKYIRNIIKFFFRNLIILILRLIFSPLPKTFMERNLHFMLVKKT